MRYALSDSEWNVIQPILPNRSRGVPRVDARTGAKWVCHEGDIARLGLMRVGGRL